MRGAVLKMTLATLLFGSYLVASKLILREAPVFTATLVRLVSAALVLGLLVALRTGLQWQRPSVRDGTLLLAQSGMGVFLFSIFAMQGVRLTGGIESGVILSLVPIAVSLVAMLFLGERLTLARGLGIALSVAGAASISAFAARGSAAATAGAGAWLGTVLLLGAVACEAVFLTFGRFLSRPLPPMQLSLVIAVLGAFMFLVPASLEPRGWLHAQYSWHTWALMVYTGVAINGVAAVLIYDSMNLVDTTVAGAFTALTPVSGTILSMLFLGEELQTYHLLGMVLVVGGVFLVATSASSSRRTKSAAMLPRTQTMEGAVR